MPWSAFGETGPPLQVPKPDDRYKADILLIVAHPDDDTEVAPYLAKAVFDEHRRVAVIYGTRGDAGGNLTGMEQGWVLGDVREMEARRALSSLGISNVWFLRGPDTPGQDVLHSLETWHHGAALENMVRLVRLTRPDVILTMLPAFVVGENHGDHQAAAVLATEAFDLAADSLTFPEQISAPRNRQDIGNYGEGLRPWQAKKLYFFDTDGHNNFAGLGPVCDATMVSPAKGIAYSQFREQSWRYYATQNSYTPSQMKEVAVAPVQFIFGKSYVQSSPTGDIFEGLPAVDLQRVRPPVYSSAERAELRLALGDPWAFYQKFWPAHDLVALETLVKPEAEINAGEALGVPLLIYNETAVAQRVTLHYSTPAGWKGNGIAYQSYLVEPWSAFPVQLTFSSPVGTRPIWQNFSWYAESGNQKSNVVQLNVYVVPPNLAPQ